MSFEEEINFLENLNIEEDFVIKKGNIPILFCSSHTMNQISGNRFKLSEPYTKAISLFCNEHYNTYSIVKIKDTGVDSNRDNHDKFNVELRRLIKEESIRLVIDLHGASKDRDFDVEFGTLNNLSADFSTIRELEEAFLENGITKVDHNNPFKGGAITQGVYSLKDVDIIQIEINGKYRDYNNLEMLKPIIKSFESFIKQYSDYIDK